MCTAPAGFPAGLLPAETSQRLSLSGGIPSFPGDVPPFRKKDIGQGLGQKKEKVFFAEELAVVVKRPHECMHTGAHTHLRRCLTYFSCEITSPARGRGSKG